MQGRFRLILRASKSRVVEVANFVDAGTSIWLKGVTHADFHAETLVEVVAQFFQAYGLPRMLTIDLDPRFVGSASGRDFPSAFVRFLLCLGIEPNVCPPHRPDKNASVERLHRTLGQEGLLVHRRRTLEQVREVVDRFVVHSNDERPNQARSCGNRPPRVACADYPVLPGVPESVDPDRWLQRRGPQAFARKVHANGSITINREPYDVKHEFAGKPVMGVVNKTEKQLDIWHDGGYFKQVPIKGLLHHRLSFQDYVTVMAQEARSEYRHYVQTHPHLTQGRLWNYHSGLSCADSPNS